MKLFEICPLFEISTVKDHVQDVGLCTASTISQARQPLARRRLGLKSHSRSSPVTGGLVLGACLQSTRTARESFRTSGIHEYPRCPADSANGGGRSSVQSRRAAAFFLAAHSSSTYLTFHSHICRLRAATS